MKIEMKTKALEMVGKRIDIDVVQRSVSIDKERHTAIFVMSTSSIDRHGDIVDQESWNLEHFTRNAPLFFNHRSSDYPLGKWLRVWLEVDPENPTEKMLMGEAEFAVEVHEDIQRAWDHLVRGDLNMVSVGFIPPIVEYDEERDCFIFKQCELMECSLVGIGSNRRALIKSNDVVQNLIEVKDQIEKGLEETDPAVTRKKNAIANIHKAIRQYSKV